MRGEEGRKGWHGEDEREEEEDTIIQKEGKS